MSNDFNKNPCITELADGEKKKSFTYMRGRICISSQMIRWQTLRDALHMRSHAELARYLLDWYYSHQSCNMDYTTSTDANSNQDNVEKCNDNVHLGYKVQNNAGYHFAGQKQNKNSYSPSCQDLKKEEKIEGYPIEIQGQNKDGFLLDGQDIQVFDTTSNELVFRTSLTGPKLPPTRVKPRKSNKRKVPYRQPLRPLRYSSESDFDYDDEELIKLDPDDPPYVPTERCRVNGSLSMSLRRRIGRQLNGDDNIAKRIKTEVGLEENNKESEAEKLLTNSSKGKQQDVNVKIKYEIKTEKEEIENSLQKSSLEEKPLQNNSVEEKSLAKNSLEKQADVEVEIQNDLKTKNSGKELVENYHVEEKPIQCNMNEKVMEKNSIEDKDMEENSMEENVLEKTSTEEKPTKEMAMEETSIEVNQNV